MGQFPCPLVPFSPNQLRSILALNRLGLRRDSNPLWVMAPPGPSLRRVEYPSPSFPPMVIGVLNQFGLNADYYGPREEELLDDPEKAVLDIPICPVAPLTTGQAPLSKVSSIRFLKEIKIYLPRAPTGVWRYLPDEAPEQCREGRPQR